jgi:hypothetical protein
LCVSTFSISFCRGCSGETCCCRSASNAVETKQPSVISAIQLFPGVDFVLDLHSLLSVRFSVGLGFEVADVSEVDRCNSAKSFSMSRRSCSSTQCGRPRLPPDGLVGVEMFASGAGEDL